MQKTLIVAAIVVLAVAAMFYVLLESSSKPTHIHFTTRDGALKAIVYYSTQKPQMPREHSCDEQFAEMPEYLYQTHVDRWREKYGGGTP